MLGDRAIAGSSSRTPIDSARVAILLCTKNGAEFLGEQLESIAEQTHTNWILFASDDGSTDQTKEILERFGQHHPQKVVVRTGPQQGVCANFLSLATDPAIDADYYAFSDQDDIWYPDKLRRALNWLTSVPDGVAALYCGRTELVTADGRSYGFSPLFARPPTFQNALVQNVGGGNTMVFNHVAKTLLEHVGRLDVAAHDWWLYQLVTATGGMTRYDPQPTVKYRQHQYNLMGSNRGWGAQVIRFYRMLHGRFHHWNATNIAALNRVPEHLITPQNHTVLTLFGKARTASLLQRLVYLKRSGVYRQTLLGDCGLVAATIIKRI